MEDDMKTLLQKSIILTLATIFGLSILATTAVTAADDPSIKGVLREDIKASMMSFIDSTMISDTYYIYDAIGGRLLELKFAKLHEGVVKKGDFYVSCADFIDKNGTKVDIDFLVIKDGDNLKTIQAVVHSLDGKKRKYHLEG
jgi:hypothetical protein